jgi:hypothetical protein
MGWSEFFRAIGKLIDYILNRLAKSEKLEAEANAQASADSIDADPSAEFVQRFGLRKPVSGAATTTAKADTGESSNN